LIVLVGILEGQFMPSGNAISNGIAHFGGFITGLISFTIIDVSIEKRKNFDAMLIISILFGIISYVIYLIRIVKAVKGL
jgi:ammonia channel protein AmtB